MRSAPTLNIWMTPRSSVAMLEKLALLKIAACKAPALNRTSCRRTSVLTSIVPASPLGMASSFIIRSYGSGLPEAFMETGEHVGQNERFGEKAVTSNYPAHRVYFVFGDGRGQKYDRDGFQFCVLPQTGGQLPSVHARHHHIQKDQVGFESLGRGERSPRAIFLLHDVMVPFEVGFQKLGVLSLIIHHENSFLIDCCWLFFVHFLNAARPSATANCFSTQCTTSVSTIGFAKNGYFPIRPPHRSTSPFETLHVKKIIGTAFNWSLAAKQAANSAPSLPGIRISNKIRSGSNSSAAASAAVASFSSLTT